MTSHRRFTNFSIKHRSFVSIATSFLAVFVLLVSSNIAYGQEEAVAASTPGKRERIVIKISHLPVKTIEEALLRVSKGVDLLVVGESATNKLVVDAPTEAIPNALGLIRELDRQQQMVNVTVTEVLTSVESEEILEAMPTRQFNNRLKDLANSGDGKVVNRMQLSGVANTPMTITIGVNQPRVTGVRTSGGRGGGGGFAGAGGRGGAPAAPRGLARSYSFEAVGTVFSGTARATEDAVLLDFQFEKSDVVDGEEDAPGSTVTSKFESTVRIPTGEVVVVGGTRKGPEGRDVRWHLILSADVVAIK